MTVVGLSHSSFWFHWIITGIVFSVICTLSLMISGLSCQYEFFMHTAFPINFMLFFMFSFSMIVFAFFLSTLIKTTKMAYTISYAFVLFAVLMEIVFSNALLTYFLFFNEKSGWVPRMFRYIFYMYPPFTFSLNFGIISRKSSTHFDDSSQSFVKGESFSWADLTTPESGQFT